MGGGFLKATSYSLLIKKGLKQSGHFEIRVGLWVHGVKQELQGLNIMENHNPHFRPAHGAKELKGQKKTGQGPLKSPKQSEFALKLCYCFSYCNGLNVCVHPKSTC